MDMDRAQPNTWTTASVGGGRWDAFLGATSRPGVGQPHAYEKTIRAKDVTETGRAVGTIGAPPAPLAEPLAELRLRIAAAEGARKEREARREAQAERALRQREQARGSAGPATPLPPRLFLLLLRLPVLLPRRRQHGQYSSLALQGIHTQSACNAAFQSS